MKVVFKNAVMVASPLRNVKVGYFSLKNALNSSLKRVTNTIKIAMAILNVSILDSLHNVPPLPQFLKINQKKTRLFRRRGTLCKALTFFHRLPLSVQGNYIKKCIQNTSNGYEVSTYTINSYWKENENVLAS